MSAAFSPRSDCVDAAVVDENGTLAIMQARGPEHILPPLRRCFVWLPLSDALLFLVIILM
jgi:hypothetical protein